MICETAIDGRLTFDDIEGPAAEQVACDSDDCALILYTSGTTGQAKGVMVTHGNLWWNDVNSLHDYDVRQSDRVFMAAPLFHIGGLNVVTLLALQKGAEIILHAGFAPGECLDAIEAQKNLADLRLPSIYQMIHAHRASEPPI